MEPLISVIVPIYNAATYLPRCLDSILCQTYTQLEIILVDDGSTDASGALCDDYASRDSRIRVHHQSNTGIGHTRNVGLSLCNGDYLTFVDADDFLFPDAIARLYHRICTDDSDLVIGNCVRSYEDGSVTAPCYTFENDLVTKDRLLCSMVGFGAVPVSPWGKLYSKRSMAGVAYPVARMGEDMLTFPSVIDRCRRISMEQEPVYYYFQHSDSLMKGETQQTKAAHLHAALHMTRYLWDNGCHSGSANWYATAAKNALTIRNRRVRLAEFDYFFDRKTRYRVWRHMDTKGRIAWLCLHIPFSDRLFSRLFGK